MFWDCTSLTSVSIPSSVTTIKGNAFEGCTSLISVDIPSSVITIGGDAFWNCTSLASVSIPNSVNKIEYYAFQNCTSLTSVRFEDGTTTCECEPELVYPSFKSVPIKELYLGRQVDYLYDWETENLETLTIGSKVTSFGTGTVYYGDNLREVNSMIEDPTQLVPEFSDVVYENATLYVPVGTKEAYAEAEGWKPFFNIQEKEELSTGIVQTATNTAGAVEVGRYDMQGRSIEGSQHGLNIVKMSDGTTRKVLVK